MGYYMIWYRTDKEKPDSMSCQKNCRRCPWPPTPEDELIRDALGKPAEEQVACVRKYALQVGLSIADAQSRFNALMFEVLNGQ